jgi:hypothetical protein
MASRQYEQPGTAIAGVQRDIFYAFLSSGIIVMLLVEASGITCAPT